MDRFLSNAVHRIDAKGRVSVPAHFRAVVARRGYSELYALRALDMPALDVGGLDLFDHAFARVLSRARTVAHLIGTERLYRIPLTAARGR